MSAILIKNSIETVEAEITAIMPLQRVRSVAESRVRNKLSNGPLRAQSNEASRFRVFCDVGAYV